jgi:hypothetical protein
MTDAAPRRLPSWVRSLADFDSRRSLILLAVGALVGLGLAGYGLFTSKGTTIARTPPEDVAMVNGKPILFSDYISQLQLDAGVPFAQTTPAQRRKVLHDMITEELTVQRAVELDLPGTNGDVRTALVGAMELQVAANVLAAPPTEGQLRAYYETNRERYRTNGTMVIREFVVPDAAGAIQAAEVLRSGGSLKAGELHRLQGEVFDITAKLQLGPALYAAIETLKPGEVSVPVTQPDGVHLILMTQRLAPVLPPFDDAMKTVYADYMRSARAPVEAANERYLRKKATILVAPGYSQ